MTKLDTIVYVLDGAASSYGTASSHYTLIDVLLSLNWLPSQQSKFHVRFRVALLSTSMKELILVGTFLLPHLYDL